MTGPDDSDFAWFDANAGDPLAGADGDHPGVAALRQARSLLDTDAGAARAAAAEARATGVPAELVPLLAIVEGCALVDGGYLAEAAALLGDAWRAHPDHAALPALLGAVQAMAGEHAAATRSLYAATVCEDPDRSLTQHRARLGRYVAAVQRGSAR